MTSRSAARPHRPSPGASDARNTHRTTERRDRQYAELRAADPDELRACVERATTISFNHRLGDQLPQDKLIALVADIEVSLVDCALRNRARRGGW